MQKYKINRKLITFTCERCGTESQKPESEYKRNKNLGRSCYCSRNCSGKSQNKNGNHKGNDYFKTHRFAHALDEFSPFRYYMRNASRRFKEFDLDLQYLKALWESQNGVCPYSGINLTLSTYKGTNETIFRASLDRIDSSLGYVKGNVQFVSTCINYLKGVMSHDDAIYACSLIAKHYNYN